MKKLKPFLNLAAVTGLLLGLCVILPASVAAMTGGLPQATALPTGTPPGHSYIGEGEVNYFFQRNFQTVLRPIFYSNCDFYHKMVFVEPYDGHYPYFLHYHNRQGTCSSSDYYPNARDCECNGVEIRISDTDVLSPQAYGAELEEEDSDYIKNISYGTKNNKAYLFYNTTYGTYGHYTLYFVISKNGKQYGIHLYQNKREGLVSAGEGKDYLLQRMPGDFEVIAFTSREDNMPLPDEQKPNPVPSVSPLPVPTPVPLNSGCAGTLPLWALMGLLPGVCFAVSRKHKGY